MFLEGLGLGGSPVSGVEPALLPFNRRAQQNMERETGIEPATNSLEG